MAGTIITAVLSFTGTNIDDIFILMILFAGTDGRNDRKRIVAGQYLGIGLLTALGVLGAFGAQILPGEYIRLLGILPVCLGIRAWRNGAVRPGEETKAKTGILSVMLLTVANGADNVGVYMPVFSRMTAGELSVIAVVFACMTALWCLAGAMLADYPLIRNGIRASERVLVPVVLIGLGVLILVF